MQKAITIKYKVVITVLTFLAVTNLYSRRNTSGNKGGGSPVITAGCSNAVANASLQLNNVRTRIDATGGSMWQDRAGGFAEYEVPKRNNVDDPKFTSIFAGALWMGGTDVNLQLKIAAVTFRASGNDFWPGPLDRTTAEVSKDECSVFDQFWGVSRAEVNEFVAHYECSIDPSCDVAVKFPGYVIPDVILEWPAKGNIVQKGGAGATYNVTEHLAPFFDRNGDTFYDPDDGDYPKYAITDAAKKIDCRTTRDIRLFGDTTLWFVFNDKGNVHTEAGGPSIGMEIRGQAFAFATNDEVNNMTFYNYEMINRSTFTLTNTYFGQWVDADLGDSQDDFVGCDASRGLGFCYNGGTIDEDNPANGSRGYGSTPPAVGVDFFEGPFADSDGIDNPLTRVVQDALDSNGIPYAGLGIGYGDGIIDNERYGMRKFVYYNNIGGVQGDPNTALDYYNYLQGIWKDGSQMVWGGNGHFSTGGTVPADLLFPGISDDLNWSTRGVSVSSDWSEFNAAAGGTSNVPGDRRFLESAGPFILEPGAVNDLTVGVVWARAVSGDNLASIDALKVADDKAQSLFDNCFKIAEGPDAPDLTFQELDQELILYLTNRGISNNFNETYNQKNPFIAIKDTLDGVYQGTDEDKDTLKFYEFQGYQVYQVKNGVITVSELGDASKAALVAQVDLKDGITQLVNYTFDNNLGANVPKEMVDGEDSGIKHSFRMTEDAFSTGDKRLVNHKTYFYIAIAYGYNEYKHYDPLDPLKLDGQTEPYIASRKMAGGRGITSFSAIPHNPAPENGGTKTNSVYGDMPQITRKEGQGNGGNELDLTASSEESIVLNKFMNFPIYQAGSGPITVKVIDPLEVKAGIYQVQFKDSTTGGLGDAYWSLLLPGGLTKGADQSIAIENEQLFLTEGISITIKQVSQPGVETGLGNGVISSSIEYEDPSKRWLGGFADREGQVDANWIRSGTSSFGPNPGDDPFDDAAVATFVDPEQDFEGMIDKTWSPYRLVSYYAAQPTPSTGPEMLDAVGLGLLSGKAVKESALANVPSVDIVFTSDKSKWTRSMVLESQFSQALSDPIGSGARHLELRKGNSVNQEGNDDGTGTGMGWFPGYAINIETGERLNIAFAEDSWLAGENGRDMLWNPTSNSTAGILQELVMGGRHYVYVFRRGEGLIAESFPAYDESVVLKAAMSATDFDKASAMSTCVWAGIPMLNEGETLLSTTAKVKLRVERSYEKFATASTFNGTLPLYEFDMTGMEAEIGSGIAADSALALINVVPNPYYAYSEYETGKLDRRIKLTNLPETCTISIYNVNGTLIRRFQKSSSSTSLDWGLTNHVDVPIASGVYLIHVLVPEIGERTLKWYGVMKPTDLNGF